MAPFDLVVALLTVIVLTASWLNNGFAQTATFSAATNFSSAFGAYFATAGDFNGDGKADLAVAYRLSFNVSVLLGGGAGSFGTATNFSAGSGPFALALGDFNRDGKLDLAVANAGSNTVSLFLSGRGVAGDFDDDNRSDVGVYSGGLWIYRPSSGGANVAVQFGGGADIPLN